MAQTKQRAIAETIHWIATADEMPDDDMAVLVRSGSPCWPVWIASHNGDSGWEYEDGTRLQFPVSHWAELPEGPQEIDDQ